MRMRFIAILAASVLLLSSFRLSCATIEEFSDASSSDSADWSFSASAYAYFVADDQNYASAIATADRNWLHLEGRYNYENLDTGSFFIGRNFYLEKKVKFQFTGMIGAVFGKTDGFGPGYETTLTWKRFGFYSEGEYVFDVNDKTGNFFYNWSQFTYSLVDWFSFGFVLQRTLAYQTEFDTERGFMIEFSRKNLSFTAYLFNLGWSSPTPAFSVEWDF